MDIPTFRFPHHVHLQVPAFGLMWPAQSFNFGTLALSIGAVFTLSRRAQLGFEVNFPF